MPRMRVVVAAALAAVVVGTGLTACQPPPPSPYDAAIFGDVPYSSTALTSYTRMITDINAGGMSFSSHLGDIKDHATTCSDTILTTESARFDTFTSPLVYTPGDNEWLDCNDPVFWLGRIRTIVFRGTGTQSRGVTPMAVTSQASAGYPENARWSRPAVTFTTIHMVGGGDNQGTDEGKARRAADIAWLHAAFDAARSSGNRGVVILAQDSPYNSDGTVAGSGRTLMEALRDETTTFSGQVLWIHGDGHTFIDDKPMLTAGGDPVTNFRRIQVEGDTKVSYIKLHVDPAGTTLLTPTLSKRY